MRSLENADVVRIMREEWTKRKVTLTEELDMYAEVPGEGEKPVLSPGLKLKHVKTGDLVTVDSVGADGVILARPEGERMMVPEDALEKDWELA